MHLPSGFYGGHVGAVLVRDGDDGGAELAFGGDNSVLLIHRPGRLEPGNLEGQQW